MLLGGERGAFAKARPPKTFSTKIIKSTVYALTDLWWYVVGCLPSSSVTSSQDSRSI